MILLLLLVAAGISGALDRRLHAAAADRGASDEHDEHETGTGPETALRPGQEDRPLRRLPPLRPLSLDDGVRTGVSVSDIDTCDTCDANATAA